MLTKLHLITLGLFLHVVLTNAETLTKVSVYDDLGKHDFVMYNTGKMYFSNNNLVIDTIGSAPVAFLPLININKILFTSFEDDEKNALKETPASALISVTPSVVSDELRVDGCLGDFNYQIYSSAGVLVQKGSANGSASIHVDSLIKGVYFIQIDAFILKFVKL